MNTPMNKSSVAFQAYKPQSITLALRGFIDADMASDFRQMLSIACQHYKYSEVHLEVSSPGGQMVYMSQMLREMTKYKSDGVHFCTHAQTEASSAAAIVLAFGSRGYRTASPEATLVFHHSRLAAPQGAAITAKVAGSVQDSMQQSDKWLINTLVQEQIKESGSQEALLQTVCQRATGVLQNFEALTETLYMAPPPRIILRQQQNTLHCLQDLGKKPVTEGMDAYRKLLIKEFGHDRPLNLALAFAMALIDDLDHIDLLCSKSTGRDLDSQGCNEPEANTASLRPIHA